MITNILVMLKFITWSQDLELTYCDERGIYFENSICIIVTSWTIYGWEYRTEDKYRNSAQCISFTWKFSITYLLFLPKVFALPNFLNFFFFSYSLRVSFLLYFFLLQTPTFYFTFHTELFLYSEFVICLTKCHKLYFCTSIHIVCSNVIQ